jgi:hypothetical protein
MASMITERIRQRAGARLLVGSYCRAINSSVRVKNV